MPNYQSISGNSEMWSAKPISERTMAEYQELKETYIVEVTLDELKEMAKRDIATARYEAEIAGVEINGAVVKTDRESQALITGVALQSVVDPTYICQWKTEQGFVELNATQIVGVAVLVRMHVQGCFNEEARLCDLIDNATTEEEIIDIKWAVVL